MAVNLWGSIIELWAADATLNGLLPSTLVSVGRTEDPIKEGDVQIGPELPYVTLFTVGDDPTERSSKGIFSQERVQISCFHTKHSLARAVQVAWRNVYDPVSISLTLDDGTFIAFIRESGGRIVEGAGVYHAFDVYVLTKSK